jgi:hypothetical protein
LKREGEGACRREGAGHAWSEGAGHAGGRWEVRGRWDAHAGGRAERWDIHVRIRISFGDRRPHEDRTTRWDRSRGGVRSGVWE